MKHGRVQVKWNRRSLKNEIDEAVKNRDGLIQEQVSDPMLMRGKKHLLSLDIQTKIVPVARYHRRGDYDDFLSDDEKTCRSL